MRSSVNHALPFVLIAALIGGGVYARDAKTAQAPANGPAADYPVVVGPAFQIGGTTYTPEDKLNYDAVGQASVGTEGGATISAAHKTLPLPSYAEVTSLESGTTILVRVERRGPMANDRLIELSPGAVAQLGLSGETPGAVRVRRVNPPEQERAMLRAGGRAPERMATPKGLLDALNRKLAATLPSAPAKSVAVPGTAPAATPRPAAATSPAPKPSPAKVAAPALQASPPPSPSASANRPVAAGSLIVQVAAFSTKPRADGVADKLGGHVSPAGRFWRVRLGPFAARAEAEAALAKAKAAGYSDARIQRAD
jgi:rare lipoprotein A